MLIDKKGVTIILVTLIITSVLFIVTYILSYSITEQSISNSQNLGEDAYYLAEAGIDYMVWMIKHDSPSMYDFEHNAAWATSTTKSDPFGTGVGEFTVNLQNSELAHGTITSAGVVTKNGKTAQRVVKTFIYKAIGQSGIGNNAGYADGNIGISNSIVNFYNGSAHSNNVFDINNSSMVHVFSDLEAVGNYIVSGSSVVTIDGTVYSQNYPPGASEIVMPAVDFNSSSTDSLINKADIIYTATDFDNLMKANQNLVINNNIIYVTGDVELKGAQTITITSGLLVAERDFTVGFKSKWGSREGPSNLYINHASGTPSGVFAGRHINFQQYTGTVNVKGVIYANDQLNVLNLDPSTASFDIRGGLVSRKLTITSCWEPVNIVHDNEILIDSIGAASTSPTIIVEHWEEEY